MGTFCLLTFILLLTVSIAFPFESVYGVRPSAKTLSPIDVTSTSATLRGIVYPGGMSTYFDFQLSRPGNASDHLFCSQTIHDFLNASHPVTCPVSGLSPGTDYRYRVRVANGDGGDSGDYEVFSTKPSSTTSTRSTTITMVGRSTDWAVTSVALDSPNPQPGTSITFAASIALLSSSGSLPQTVDVQCQIDGQSCGAGSITYLGPVGQPSTVHTNAPWVATPGTHTLTWSVAMMNDPNPANNIFSTSFTVQPSTLQSVSSSTTQASTVQSSTSNLQTTVTQVQTVTQQPTSAQTATLTSSQQTQVASQPDVLGMIQQNSLLVIGALGLLAVLIAVIALKRRGGGQTSASQTIRSKPGTGTLFCVQCGTANASASKYCEKCGHALNAG